MELSLAITPVYFIGKFNLISNLENHNVSDLSKGAEILKAELSIT
jgi:hypothetical protein